MIDPSWSKLKYQKLTFFVNHLRPLDQKINLLYFKFRIGMMQQLVQYLFIYLFLGQQRTQGLFFNSIFFYLSVNITDCQLQKQLSSIQYTSFPSFNFINILFSQIIIFIKSEPFTQMYLEQEEKDYLALFEAEKKVNQSVEVDTQDHAHETEFQISQGQLEDKLKNYLCYYNNSKEQKKSLMNIEEPVKLKRPPMGQSKFSNIWPFILRFRYIMSKALNSQQLKFSEFQQFQSYFKLDKNDLKRMNYPDPVVLQTLRFAIFNRQEIPSSLVKVVCQMAKTNMIKDWQVGYYILFQAVTYDIIALGFEPPLDLYLQFIETGLINPSPQQLIEVFTRNQFLFKSLSNSKQFFPTTVEKKMLIFNQFPYLISIFDKISNKDPAGFNFGGLKFYLSTIVSFLQFSNQYELLQRYLPEVKCRYLKIKSNLATTDLQFLFASLKSIQQLTKEDFKIMYQTRPKNVANPTILHTKSWTKFGKYLQYCEKILNKKDFHMGQKQMVEIGELFEYDKCLPDDIVLMKLFYSILREQSYNNQQFPKSLIKTIIKTIKSVPDKKIKKQFCYILLIQYCNLIEQSIQKRMQIIKQQEQLDKILDEGREIALDILLNQKEQKLLVDETRCATYLKIIKKLIADSQNKSINHKAILLYDRMNKIHKLKIEQIKFYQENLVKANQLIQMVEQKTKNGVQLTISCINVILRILVKNKRSEIKRRCLSTLRNVVKNIKNGQKLTQNFEQGIIRFMIKLYKETDLTQQCKSEIIKLLIEFTNLTESYSEIDLLSKFLLSTYLTSIPNTVININSSFGVFVICLNFKSQSGRFYPTVKKVMHDFGKKLVKAFNEEFLPTSRGDLNILCSVIVLAKNQVFLPSQIIQQLTEIASKNKQLKQIILLGIYLYIKNKQSQKISQKSLMNICQMLSQDIKSQPIGVQIIQVCFKKLSGIPKKVRDKIVEQLVNFQKCPGTQNQILYKFYRSSLKNQSCIKLFQEEDRSIIIQNKCNDS